MKMVIFHSLGCCPNLDPEPTTDPNRCKQNQKDTENRVRWFLQQHSLEEEQQVFVMGSLEEIRTFSIINDSQERPLSFTPISLGKIAKLKEVIGISKNSPTVLYTAKEFEGRYRGLLWALRMLDFSSWGRPPIEVVGYERCVAGAEHWSAQMTILASIKDVVDLISYLISNLLR